ncbi:MAG: DUF2799 domain-containing protein [Granulosicoccus sp.]
MYTQGLRIRKRRASTRYRVSSAYFLLLLSLVLTSCQTITRIKCNSKNWEKAGFRDGAAGHPADSSFLEYSGRCLAAGAELDKSVYMAGYHDGLSTFCTKENGVEQAQAGFENTMVCAIQVGSAFDDGFAQGLKNLCDASGGQRFGVSGGVYRGTCPPETEQIFLANYLDALATALPQSIADVTILEGRKDALRSRIGSLETAIYQYDTAKRLADTDNNTSKVNQLSNDQSNLTRKLFRLESDERTVNSRLKRARKKSEDMQEMLLKWKPKLDS